MAAVKAARKASGPGTRPPPPPISSSTSPIEIYDSIDYDPPPLLQPAAHVVRRPSNRRGLPPVPLADDNDYVQADDMGGDYLEPDEVHAGKQGRRSQHYVEPIAPMSQAEEFYYVDTRAPNNYNTRVYVTNQQDYSNRYGGSPPGRYPEEEEDLYEGPQYDGDFLEPHDYPQRNPVDRRQSRKNMGKAIVTGLNTARVKEIKGRLRPAFGPDELMDSVEKRHTVGGGMGGGGSPQDVIENVDVSGMSVMERMKLLETKAASNKGPPPPTFPKPRPVSLGAVTAQQNVHSGGHPGGQSGGHSGGHPGGHPGGHSGGHPGGHPGGHSDSHSGGHSGGHPGGHSGGPSGGHSGGHSERHSDGHLGTPSSSVLNARPAASVTRNESRLTVPPPSSSKRSSQIALDEAPWYFGTIDQNRCEEKLKDLNTEGAFLIRQSKKGETRMQPYTLCVFHDGDIYNLMIREKSNTKLAVGSEKNGEPEFATLADLVKFHADIPIDVIPKNKSRKSTGGRVWLKMTPLK